METTFSLALRDFGRRLGENILTVPLPKAMGVVTKLPEIQLRATISSISTSTSSRMILSLATPKKPLFW